MTFFPNVGNAIFHTLPAQPRRVEPFMALYEAIPSTAGVEFMELFTSAGFSFASHDSGLAVLGNMEVRLDVEVDTWLAPAGTLRMLVASAFLGLSDYRWFVAMDEAGIIRLDTKDSVAVQRSFEGSTQTWTAGTRWQIRGTLNVDDGGGNSVGSWFRRAATVGLEENAGWGSIGSSTFSAFTSLNATPGPVVTMGNEFTATRVSATGRLYRFMLYDGIDGTVVADLDFDDAAPTETEVWDDQAQLRLWMMEGAEGIDWLHSTSDTLSVIPGGILELEGGVPTFELEPATSEIPGGVLQLVGGTPREFLPQTIAVTVNGMEYSFRAGSLNITKRTGGRSTLNIDIIDRAATANFSFNQEIKVYGLEGEVIFAGWIDTMESESWLTKNGVSEGMIHRIGAKDNHYLIDKRIVFGQYSALTCGDVVRDLIEKYLGEEGIAAGTIEDGADIDIKTIDGEQASRALDELSNLSDFVWKVDENRRLHFRERMSVTAPVVSYGTGMLRGTVRRRRQNQQYRNRQFSVGGGDTPTQPMVLNKTVAFNGDGSVKEFHLPFYPLSITSVLRNSSTQTFKEVGLPVGNVPTATTPTAPDSTRQWYWSRDSRIILQDASGTALSATDTLTISYSALVYARVVEFVGDGSTSTWRVPAPAWQESTDFPANTGSFHVDFGAGFVREFGTPFHTLVNQPAEMLEWGLSSIFTTGSPTANRRSWNGIAFVAQPLPAGARARIIYGDLSRGLVTNIELPDEITRNRAVEGNTTSGIVEVVVSTPSAASEEEAIQKVTADLLRHAHDTEQVEFQTWNSELTDGEIAPVRLEDFGIEDTGNPVDFLVEQVTIIDRFTGGQKDTKGSPLLYSVVAGRCLQCTDTAVGSHQRFSDVLGGLKTLVRS